MTRDEARVDAGRGRERPAAPRARRGHDVASAVRLGEVDRRVLEIVCAHRVVTQTQLERLLAEVPGRTVRYRTRRLHGLGLVGARVHTASGGRRRITSGPRAAATS